jgi:glycosyltransferase involved in cell wall biosynthesis
MNNILLSIVIPCYNEAETIPTLLVAYKEVIKERNDIEIILVNDGSKDSTQEVLEREKGKYPFLRVLHNYPNGGYGSAVTTGLSVAKGKYIGWTHGDLQTPPNDILRALEIVQLPKYEKGVYVKGRRQKRPLGDVVFTFGMSIFESLLFQKALVDINAQPNIFPASFYATWKNPPKDFSLDLYSLYLAKKQGLKVVRFPVIFGKRIAGISSWNIDWKSKIKFIKRTIAFSFRLRAV